ncbi:unnamed protein product [Meloidogyne enterolobii]|uniref:Uncharacterized protein n=1 Tax=Meloidogyne enterolobii TaxID=390850 RepID=A0ACB0ZZT9_MELEN
MDFCSRLKIIFISVQKIFDKNQTREEIKFQWQTKNICGHVKMYSPYMYFLSTLEKISISNFFGCVLESTATGSDHVRYFTPQYLFS